MGNKKERQRMTLDELRIEHNLQGWHMTQILGIESSGYRDIKNESVKRYMWHREIAVLVNGESRELEKVLESLVGKYKEASEVEFSIKKELLRIIEVIENESMLKMLLMIARNMNIIRE